MDSVGGVQLAPMLAEPMTFDLGSGTHGLPGYPAYTPGPVSVWGSGRADDPRGFSHHLHELEPAHMRHAVPGVPPRGDAGISLNLGHLGSSSSHGNNTRRDSSNHGNADGAVEHNAGKGYLVKNSKCQHTHLINNIL
jgi:hypothetical protein